jgi:hypothetical protein
MILSSHGIIGSSIVQGFDADYQAVLDYATTQGYTLPSASQQAKQNKLLVDLKNAGVWSKLDTFAVFATDGSSDFALIDWKRLSQYTAVNSPTFTSNQGFKGDGSSAYINSNYNPVTSAVNYSLDDASFGYYMREYDTAPGGLEMAFGCFFSSAPSWIRYTTKRLYFNSLEFLLYSNFTHANNRLVFVNRTSSNNVNVIANGSITDSLAITSTDISNANFELFRISSNYSNSQLSMVYTGSNITSNASDFNTAWNNYYNSL